MYIGVNSGSSRHFLFTGASNRILRSEGWDYSYHSFKTCNCAQLVCRIIFSDILPCVCNFIFKFQHHVTIFITFTSQLSDAIHGNKKPTDAAVPPERPMFDLGLPNEEDDLNNPLPSITIQ